MVALSKGSRLSPSPLVGEGLGRGGRRSGLDARFSEALPKAAALTLSQLRLSGLKKAAKAPYPSPLKGEEPVMEAR